MITKPEVRAIVLSKLELFGAGTLWDVGASSGSIGVEAARLAPGLRVYAIEKNAEDCERIRLNAKRVPVSVIHGTAPEAFRDLARPDRIFVGGGGIDVFTCCIEPLSPGGVLVGTFATLETALAAREALGENAEFVQISINRGVPVGPQARLRLEADNPVFLVWGSPS